MRFFLWVSLVFLNSVYHLFTDAKTPNGSALRPLASEKTIHLDGLSPAKSMAAVTTPEMTGYYTQCHATGETLHTSATKLRITGPFCGAVELPGRNLAGERPDTLIQKGSSPVELQIVNHTNKYAATVLSDHQVGHSQQILFRSNRARIKFRWNLPTNQKRLIK